MLDVRRLRVLVISRETTRLIGCIGGWLEHGRCVCCCGQDTRFVNIVVGDAVETVAALGIWDFGGSGTGS